MHLLLSVDVFKWNQVEKVRIFYSHTPILHACHVSDDRSRSMICIIFIIYIFFFFVRPVVHHGLLFCEYLSLTWLNFILSHWDFIAPIIYSNPIFLHNNASEKNGSFIEEIWGYKKGLISMSLEAEIYYTKPTLIMLLVFFCQWCSSFYGLLKYILVHFNYIGQCIFVN